MHVGVGQFRSNIGHLEFGGVGERPVVRAGRHKVATRAGWREVALVKPGSGNIGAQGDPLFHGRRAIVTQRADLDFEAGLAEWFEVIVEQVGVEHHLPADRIGGPVRLNADPLVLAHQARQGEELDALGPDTPVVFVAGLEAQQPEAVAGHHHALARPVALPRHQRVAFGAGLGVGKLGQHGGPGARGEQRREAVERRDAAP